MTRIPIAIPELSGNEEKYAVDAIRSTWISSTGMFIERFEKEFAEICGAQHALGVSNGTVALHLALLTLGIGPGDEVLIPSLTYIATANAVRYVGAEPVFVDVDKDTWCIDPVLLEQNINERTRAIIAVHLYGHSADMDAINHIAALHGLRVVEDAAEAFMASYKGRPTGSMADIATFSFYGNKVITSGEGGAITLNDDSLAQYARMLRGQGMDPNRRYYFPITGYNFRLTNVAAAILCAQLEQKYRMIQRRKEIFDKYKLGLSDIAGIGFQPKADWAEISPWLYCITIDSSEYGINRGELAHLLELDGVETRPFFYSLHRLPPFRKESELRGEDLPITDKLSSSGMNLPTYVGLSDSQIEFICERIRKHKK